MILRNVEKRTTVDDTVDVVQIREALEHGESDLGDHLDVDGADLFVYAVERALVHELHADADVGVGEERAVEGDDVLGVAVVHDLQLAQDLLPHGRLSVNEHNLCHPIAWAIRAEESAVDRTDELV